MWHFNPSIYPYFFLKCSLMTFVLRQPFQTKTFPTVLDWNILLSCTMDQRWEEKDRSLRRQRGSMEMLENFVRGAELSQEKTSVLELETWYLPAFFQKIKRQFFFSNIKMYSLVLHIYGWIIPSEVQYTLTLTDLPFTFFIGWFTVLFMVNLIITYLILIWWKLTI